jgi:hypothetical protein
MDEVPPRVRHTFWLVGPLVTFVAVVALLIVARSYDQLPVRPPECSFRKVAGIPCLGCGGTRAARALAEGKIVEATRFNPAVVMGVLVSVAWVAAGWTRYHRGAIPPSITEQNRRLKRNLVIAGGMLSLNWIYLICCLP